MDVLIDTCVIVDVLTKREPFFGSSKKVLDLVANSKLNGCLAATSIKDIYYLLHKRNHSDELSRQAIHILFDIFSVLDVTYEDCVNALAKDVSCDYEDAILIECANRYSLDAIITRDKSGFGNSKIPVLLPEEIK